MTSTREPVISFEINRPNKPPGGYRVNPLGYLAAAVVGALLVLAAFSIGRATGAADDESIAATTTTSAPATTSVATTPPLTVSPTSTVVPAIATPLDPVAAIAAIAAPSVVQIRTDAGVGSGIVFRSNGYILTAAHVVEDATASVTVRLADGRVFAGELVGTNDATDVAVLSIQAENLAVATLAIGSQLEIGQLAVALGSPFGFEQTVTAGIVSSVDRLVDGVAMVQTDAAINPGNSGGPLVDRTGAVIGISDVIFSTTGVSDGVGFAISIDLAALVAEQIIAGQEVELGFLGVFISDETGAVPGALVEQVETGSPADGAGLLAGDIVVAFDGEAIINRDALGAKVIKRRPGDTVTIGVYRDGAARALSVTVGAIRK